MLSYSNRVYMRSGSSKTNEIEDYDQLVGDYQHRIFFFIRSMVYNKEDAKDILQDVNIVLFKKQAYYVSGTDFKSWAFTIARFECLSYLTKLKKNMTISIDNETEERLADTAEEMADAADPHLATLKTCMQKLPEASISIIT